MQLSVKVNINKTRMHRSMVHAIYRCIGRGIRVLHLASECGKNALRTGLWGQ